MKILFAISSPGGETDYVHWIQLNDGQHFDNFFERLVDADKKLMVLNGKNGGSYRMEEEWLYHVIAQKIKEAAAGHEAAVIFHDKSSVHFLKNILETDINTSKIEILGFSTGLSNPWDTDIAPFIEAFKTGPNDIIEKFNSLWSKIEKKSPEDSAKKAMGLRARLLTPLVALDLLGQSKIADKSFSTTETLLESIQSAIQDIAKDEFSAEWGNYFSGSVYEDLLSSALNDYCNKDFHVRLEKLSEKLNEKINLICFS